MPSFPITVTDTVTTTFVVQAQDVAGAQAEAERMAEERDFPADARERASREISIGQPGSANVAAGPDYTEPDATARREGIEAAKLMKPAAIAEFVRVVDATIEALKKQPFHVQVACGLDALTAELLILRGEG